MKESLRILMLEDNASDADLIRHLLIKEKPDCKFKVVMTEKDYLEAFDAYKPDLILSDNNLPQFNATEALRLFNQHHLDIPFILITGTVSEEFAVGIIKLGADDYILKDRLIRLPAAIDAALEKKKAAAAVRHSNEIRKLIMNSALDAIVCIDKTGTITVWNRQAEKLFGWKEEDITGRVFVETIISEQYREAHTKSFNRYLKTGVDPILNKVFEITALHRKGNTIPIELAIVPVKQPGDIFFCAFIRDITARKKAENVLKAMEKKILQQKIEEQKKISRAIIKAQEEEKNRLGLELHDNITQILTGTKLHLAHAGERNESIKQAIKYPMELINSSIEELRLLSHKQVTPLRNVNLEELINKLLSNFNKDYLPKLNFSYAATEEFLPDDLKVNIYRIIQEQMNNILRHANAKNVDISVKTGDKNISIIVNDDGRGFKLSAKRKGIGISNIMNRVESYNGKLEIKSNAGKGCRISVTIPFNPRKNKDGRL